MAQDLHDLGYGVESLDGDNGQTSTYPHIEKLYPIEDLYFSFKTAWNYLKKNSYGWAKGYSMVRNPNDTRYFSIKLNGNPSHNVLDPREGWHESRVAQVERTAIKQIP